MQPRKHGLPPYHLAVLHGGPGGTGEVAPLAEELAARGIPTLEPFQTGHSIAEQVAELDQCLAGHATLPVTLLGWSWGAWLACFLAAEHPDRVAKLILVGSAPFRTTDGRATREARLDRLSEEERREFQAFTAGRQDGAPMDRFFQLLEKADSHDPVDAPAPRIDYDPAIHKSVWTEAARLRETGALLEIVARIRCPVIALHGAEDPHPADGVRAPLQSALTAFDFHLLPACGHKPWIERQAREPFFALLNKHISQA